MERRADWEPTVGGGIAYERIKQAIAEGLYPPGERLIEQRLADDFDLSSIRSGRRSGCSMPRAW